MAKKKIKLDKEKPIHPYSRKAKQLRRELLKPEKIKKLNPLKELLLSKFKLFHDFLLKSQKIPLSDIEIDQVLETWFQDCSSVNNFKDYRKTLVESELKMFKDGHGIEIPKVTCAKMCKRLLEISNVTWSCVETLELMKYTK